jgi:hypothetical protein
MTQEREDAVDAATVLIRASLSTLYDLDRLTAPGVDIPRARTEEELTVMQVMIANAQATLAVAELLYAREISDE